VNVCDIVSGEVIVSRAVSKNVVTTIEEHQIQSASFLRELVLLINNYLVFFRIVVVSIAMNSIPLFLLFAQIRPYSVVYSPA
jgi:hypothetical protein